MFNKDNNPYYRMLMRRHIHRLSARKKSRFLWIGLMFPVAALPVLSDLAFSLSCYCIYLLLFIPFLMARTFAEVSAADVMSANYDLIMLTPLDDKVIVWGHFHSMLDKNLLSGYLPFGQLPVAFTIISAGVFLASYLRDEYEAGAVLFLVINSLSFTGLYWMLGFAGIALGLAFRRPGIATFLTSGMSLITISVWGLSILTLFDPDNSRPVSLFLTLLPYPLTACMVFLAYRFARNPVISPPSA